MSHTNTLSTHVLDTATGRPAEGLPIRLEFFGPHGVRTVGEGITDVDGRVRDFFQADARLVPGTYRMRFETAVYHAKQAVTGFYPYVEVVFNVEPAGGHYHVPLLLSPYGYSTYRGS